MAAKGPQIVKKEETSGRRKILSVGGKDRGRQRMMAMDAGRRDWIDVETKNSQHCD